MLWRRVSGEIVPISLTTFFVLDSPIISMKKGLFLFKMVPDLGRNVKKADNDISDKRSLDINTKYSQLETSRKINIWSQVISSFFKTEWTWRNAGANMPLVWITPVQTWQLVVTRPWGLHTARPALLHGTTTPPQVPPSWDSSEGCLLAHTLHCMICSTIYSGMSSQCTFTYRNSMPLTWRRLLGLWTGNATCNLKKLKSLLTLNPR